MLQSIPKLTDMFSAINSQKKIETPIENEPDEPEDQSIVFEETVESSDIVEYNDTSEESNDTGFSLSTSASVDTLFPFPSDVALWKIDCDLSHLRSYWTKNGTYGNITFIYNTFYFLNEPNLIFRFERMPEF